MPLETDSDAKLHRDLKDPAMKRQAIAAELLRRINKPVIFEPKPEQSMQEEATRRGGAGYAKDL